MAIWIGAALGAAAFLALCWRASRIIAARMPENPPRSLADRRTRRGNGGDGGASDGSSGSSSDRDARDGDPGSGDGGGDGGGGD